MRPTLEPGDWLLVDPEGYAERPPAAGDLVLVTDPRSIVTDPRSTGRLLVKRVAEVYDGGRELFVVGDAHDGSTDSRAFGSVTTATVEGRPWFRYWPPRRMGRVG